MIMTALLAFCLTATAGAGERPDDSDFLPEVSTSHPGGWNFDIVGLKVGSNRPSFHRSSKHLSTFSVFNGWGFGFSGALNPPQGSGLNMMRSFNFCIEDLLAFRLPVGRRGDFSLGMGIDLRNYRITGPDGCFMMDPETHTIVIGNYPEGAYSYSGTSRLRVFSTTYNLKYVHYLGQGFRLAFGPELSVVRRPGKKHEIRNKYLDADGVHKERIRGINTNRIGFNLVGVVNYKNCMGFYVKYSPTSVLENGYGPQFQSISAGIMLLGL